MKKQASLNQLSSQALWLATAKRGRSQNGSSVVGKSWIPILFCCCLFFSGCLENGAGNGKDPQHPGGTEQALFALVPAAGCDDVLVQVKQNLTQSMEAAVDQELEYYLEYAQDSQSYCNGNGYYGGDDSDVGYGPVDASSSSDAGSSSSTGSVSTDEESSSTAASDGSESHGSQAGDSASDYSETNNQVKNVDEADFIKNDGAYIYILADNKFQVLDAWPPQEARRISTLAISGTPKNLFVKGTMAVIYSAIAPQPSYSDCDPADYNCQYDTSYLNSECTYGYDCEFTGDGQNLKITVVDISRREEPKVVRELTFNGSYLNARRIEDMVYTVVVFPEILAGQLSYYPEDIDSDRFYSCYNPYTEAELRGLFEALKQQNRELIDRLTISEILPGLTDTRYVNGERITSSGLFADCQNFYLSQEGDGRSLLSVVSFQMNDGSSLAATTVVGKPGAIYANEESLYIASRHYAEETNGWYFEESESAAEATTIHKFQLSASQIDTHYQGSGVVKGRLLNQFSMDEKEGYLRIATTTGYVWDQDCHNSLFVVREREGVLSQVGAVDHIAPGEDIRSIRFDGDKAFMVTFKKTDPLFVIDLSDPEYPIIQGELKIPGFSTYIQLMDETHLLTIGYDADDEGYFAWYKGIILQIFEVSDPTRPNLVHKEYIGTRGSTSEAAVNHLAFNYFAAKDLLALPMVVCEGGGDGGSYGNQMTFNGLMVYRVTPELGFEYLGGIPHEAPELQTSYNSACYSWWTEAGSTVKRSIFMDDYAYSVASDAIDISALTDLSHPIKKIDLLGE